VDSRPTALRLFFVAAAVTAALTALTAAVATAHQVSPQARLSASQVSRVETSVLGPEHAAEHAAEARQLRRAMRAWKRLSPAERRRITRRARARERAVARKSDALDPSVYGQWTTGPFQIPVHAIHMALLPTGKVIFFAYPFFYPPTSDTPVAGDAWIWDPSTSPSTSDTADPTKEPGVFTHVPPPVDPETGGPASLFCAGLSMLPNGDVFVTGGTLRFPTTTSPVHLGLRRAYTFNPWTNTWIKQPDMQHGRWYPSHVELADGRVAVLAGSNETDGGDNSQLEIFNPTEDPNGVGTWTYASQGNRVTDLYPHLTLLGDGRIFLGGPGPGDSGVLDPASMTWTNVGNHPVRRMYGTEVLDPNGTGPSMKVTEIGGFPDNQPPATGPHPSYPPTETTQSIDLSVAAPDWSLGPSMNVARANHNTLWLPDGELLTVGGGHGRDQGSTYILQDGDPEHQVELFDPATGQWRVGPAQQINRAYHSTAVLLPDGRVLSAGDDDASPSYPGQPYRPFEGTNHNSGEIYSPPYLFRGPRPQITSAPNGALYNSAFHVGVSGANPADTHAVLIPPAAVTHSTNPNPRIVPLRSAPVGDGLDLVAPANANVAPRGWYMLFVVNSQGVPSVATWVHVGYPSSAGAGAGPEGSVLGTHTKSRAVKWVRVKTHQSFRKGRFVAMVGLAHNRSTIRASALMVTPARITKRTRSVLLAKKVMRRQRAGAVKVVVQLKPRAIRRLLRARRAHVLLKLRISAPGAATYTGSKRISNTR
jgi:galactose oxidase-like protein